MKTLLYNIFLTFIWATVTMSIEVANLIFGFVVSYFVLWFIQRKNKEEKYFKRIPRFISFSVLFFKEIIKGSLRIGYDIITPSHNMNPGIIAVPLDAKTDREITLLANTISLTPGTTSIAVSKDRKYLYVYNMYIGKDINQNNIDKKKKEFVNKIKNGLEKKILEVLR